MSSDREPTIPPCFDCAQHATERLEEMFVGIVQEKRIALGQRPAERPVFRKLHGVAHGTLEMRTDLPPELKAGIFAHDKLTAWVRFSSDTSPTSPDLKSTVGIGIKLFGVSSDALGAPGDTADVIMQNFPVFFVDNAEEMCEFTYAGVVAGDYPGYLAKHPKTAKILDEMARVEGSVLTTTYWAILPFRCGKPDQVVKYRLDPETPPENVANNAANYLATDFTTRLGQRAYRFRFMVQRRTDPSTMPLDQATVDWPESQSPFVEVGTLVLPQQNVLDRGQAEYGQGLAYNIWRVPEVNAPAAESSIAAVRKVVYAASVDVRHSANGQPLQDQAVPRAASEPKPKPDDCIVKAVIYPSIGVARVGTSPKDYFIGPEVTNPPPAKPGFYRDASGALKRQAARFRVYGVNARGEIVRELSGGPGAKITWSVELANTKAAWYGFQLALDIPEASQAPPTTLRNAAVADRKRLAIKPGKREVSGANAPAQAFDSGEFMGTRVYLGEIFTDDAGRLVVLGGHGKSASADGLRAITFANNEGWHDDVSDGPVTAHVELDGTALHVVPAWVVVAPPNYGPQQKSVRTMWDAMRDVAIKAGQLARPMRPSFTFDILPIFQRLNALQWVNAGFAAGFGWGSAYDFAAPDWIARLGDGSVAHAQLRKVIANQFRNYKVDSWSPVPWPWNYGDAMNNPPAETPLQHSALSDTQLAMLQQWAAGNFDPDHDPARKPPAAIEDVPVAEQGNMLTRAALEFCIADAFHPGCEMTWTVRASSMYLEPFRFLHAPEGWIEPGFGEILTGDGVTIPNGPLYGQMPGSITRWMAVPWQTDTASCRSGYDKSYDPYVPSFWPARVPNQVLSKANYEIVVDTKKPMQERLAAFANRAAWVAPLGSISYTDQINNMVHGFDHLGVVEVHDGPSDKAFPPQIEVEDRHTPIKPDTDKPREHRRTLTSGTPVPSQRGKPAAFVDVDLSGIEKVRRFPGGLRR